MKSRVYPTSQDRKLFHGFVVAAKKWKWKPAGASIHHGASDRGNPDPDTTWFAIEEIPLRLQIHDDFVAHVQIRMEVHEKQRRSRVIIFGRRVKSFAQRSGNTQHVTFNSTNLDDSGYWMRPTLNPSQAMRVSRSLRHLQTPRLADRRIHLGLGDSDRLLSGFLISLVAVARAKPGDGSQDGVSITPKAAERIIASIAAKNRKAAEPKSADASVATGWILIHSQERYRNYEFESPREELEHLWPTRWNRHWHWKLPQPMKEDHRPRTLLLAWDGCVFGEATATVTRDIARDRRKDLNFAFILSDYQPTNLIPLTALELGDRANNHRGLLQLRPENLAAFNAANQGTIREQLRPKAIPEAAQIESEIELGVNPQKASGQGFGLTAKEKKCVELHAMKKAKAWLEREGFIVDDVSRHQSFDLLARGNNGPLFVEVKGTTGEGAKISLTQREIELHRTRHPSNMLMVVHSIALQRGERPRASGGTLSKYRSWQIQEDRLAATSFSYRLR